jgi:hypothetical protein
MLLGHYGVAFAAKRAAPRTSLGTLTLAAQLLDDLWPIFLLLGLEQVRVTPGLMAASPFDFVHYPITRSLVGAIGWSVLLGGLYYAIKRYRRGAVVVGLLVLSHWFLDLPMASPGSSAVAGLGGEGWARGMAVNSVDDRDRADGARAGARELCAGDAGEGYDRGARPVVGGGHVVGRLLRRVRPRSAATGARGPGRRVCTLVIRAVGVVGGSAPGAGSAEL